EQSFEISRRQNQIDIELAYEIDGIALQTRQTLVEHFDHPTAKRTVPAIRPPVHLDEIIFGSVIRQDRPRIIAFLVRTIAGDAASPFEPLNSLSLRSIGLYHNVQRSTPSWSRRPRQM